MSQKDIKYHSSIIELLVHPLHRLQNSRFFFPIRKVRSTVSVILACEVRKPHTSYGRKKCDCFAVYAFQWHERPPTSIFVATKMVRNCWEKGGGRRTEKLVYERIHRFWILDFKLRRSLTLLILLSFILFSFMVWLLRLTSADLDVFQWERLLIDYYYRYT